ncbi:unnamed protein product [Sordaria macrospora k-hell]|uniref:WGS project CABT00000000 data, contig 2.51 n=1 Tax=Sordaria macrospora (strain ATCC MYA-333 / DSM 997 / K(L3346) / K-hell) TaxID=771870 RepID=F7W9E9_SORMK|nr:uncharacterized protein SMAC_08449 [Sordaria macrospora k-hell]CCC13940.1 unnamed protein product [Sordaria macrospora k-hell]
MHPPTLLTTLATLGLTTLASAAALGTTTSASTDSHTSSTCSSSSAATSMSVSDSTGPQSIKEYIHALQAKHAAANNRSSNSNNTTMPFGAASTKHVSGMKAFEVPHCCLDGCDWCSTKICGPGQFCSDWPYMSCCASIILWDTEKDEMLDVFTTEGLTVNMVYD